MVQFITAEQIIPAFTRRPNDTTQPWSASIYVTNLDLVSIVHHFTRSIRSSSNATGDGKQKDFGSKTNETNYQKDVCGHIVTTYILPSLMHLIAYILGFFYFRINENEQLYALMEKVFLAVNQKFKKDSQDKVIRTLKQFEIALHFSQKIKFIIVTIFRIFIIMGVLWVVFAMSIHILFKATFGLKKAIFEPLWASTFVSENLNTNRNKKHSLIFF